MGQEEKQVHIRLKSGLYRELKLQCTAKGISIKSYLTKLIDDDQQQTSIPYISNDDKKKNILATINLLQKSYIFADVGYHGLEKLAESATSIRYRNGEFVYHEEQDSRSLKIVKSGLVKIYHIFPSGKDFILDILSTGDIFGEMSVIDGIPHYASAQAMEGTEIISIPRMDLLAFLELHPEVVLKLLSLEMKKTSNIARTLIGLVADNANQRVVKVLNSLNQKYGEKLSFNHREFAEMSGTTVETVTRIFSELKSKGAIEIGRGWIKVIDADKIKFE